MQSCFESSFPTMSYWDLDPDAVSEANMMLMSLQRNIELSGVLNTRVVRCFLAWPLE